MVNKKVKRLLLSGGLLLSGSVMAYDFSYDNTLIAYLKLNENVKPQDVVDGYMNMYRPTVWQKSHNDEFEMEDKRKETIDIIKKKISDMDLNKSFTIMTLLQFGDYDFSKKAFAFTPLTGNAYYHVDKCCYSGITNTVNVFFDNGDIVNGFPMSEDKAKQFLATRKDKQGSVNRRVFSVIDFTMKESTEENKIIGHINSVSVYDKEGGKLLQQYKG
ncbi:DUF4852 domain-containing protein [Serratia marcescens]|nr:DUF4852 domain-containing protein [Serratia marcescens]ELQ9442355.1 DUF4852 domain-containing protein [Serratia marcescens]ELT5563115.1 DUF4852 domain-containing protein [Serratia marcescens]